MKMIKMKNLTLNDTIRLEIMFYFFYKKKFVYNL